MEEPNDVTVQVAAIQGKDSISTVPATQVTVWVKSDPAGDSDYVMLSLGEGPAVCVPAKRLIAAILAATTR
jgi:hypothetical protein